MQTVKNVKDTYANRKIAAVEFYTFGDLSHGFCGDYAVGSFDEDEVADCAPVLDFELMDAEDYCNAFNYYPEMFSLDEDSSADDIFEAIYGDANVRVLVIALYPGWKNCYYQFGELYPSKEHYDMLVKESQKPASYDAFEEEIKGTFFNGYALPNMDMELDDYAIMAVWNYTHKLKEARMKLGMSQSKFADLLNVPFRTIQNWETYKSLPPEYVYTMALDRVYRTTQLRDLEFMVECATGFGKEKFSPFFKKAGGNYMELARIIVESEREDIRGSQAYAIASKRINPDIKHWNRVRAIMGESCRKTVSDAGGLKVGNDGFSYLIGNGRGDGTTRYAVLESGTFNTDMLNYVGCIEGNNINVYAYDCGDEVAETLCGRYGIYCYDGLIILEKSVQGDGAGM